MRPTFSRTSAGSSISALTETEIGSSTYCLARRSTTSHSYSPTTCGVVPIAAASPEDRAVFYCASSAARSSGAAGLPWRRGGVSRPAAPRRGDVSGDALSDVLQAVRLRGVPLGGSGAVLGRRFTPVAGGAACFMPKSERVMEFHLVVEGECWTGLAGAAPERAQAATPSFPRPVADTTCPPWCASAKTACRARASSAATSVTTRAPSTRCWGRAVHVARVFGRGPLGDLVRLAVAGTAVPQPGGGAPRAWLAETWRHRARRAATTRSLPSRRRWFTPLKPLSTAPSNAGWSCDQRLGAGAATTAG